jgi:hypothetical protein
MTTVFVDGEWQSVSEKDHPQLLTPGWNSARWIEPDGTVRKGLHVVRDGVQAVGYAVRLVPLPGINLLPDGLRLHFRVMRYPVDPVDNGTYWIGPIAVPDRTAAFYFAPGVYFDHKGGHKGDAYGVDIKTSRSRVRIDQLKLTLLPVTPA